MKRFLPLLLALLCSILFSACVYDPYAYHGSSHDHYHGGYHDGFYSDYYIGIHNNYYRYRHTRCSHCSHYPCRGGHQTHYHTYYRDYQKPLHRNGNGRRSSYHGGNRPRSSERSYPGKVPEPYVKDRFRSSPDLGSYPSRSSSRSNPPKSYPSVPQKPRSSSPPSRPSRDRVERPSRTTAPSRPSPPSTTKEAPGNSSAPSKTAPSKSKR